MFTPTKSKRPDFIDVTVLNTPQPQATSTVQRKSTLENKFLNKDITEAIYKQSAIHKNDATQKCDESSLGLLSNISSLLAEVSGVGDLEKQNDCKLDAERELARKLLQRCSDINSASIIHDTNKENNANVQNSFANVTPSTLTDQSKYVSSNDSRNSNERTLGATVNKTSSIAFEPNEISARSSGHSRSSGNRLTPSSLSPSKQINKISFDSTTAELMAQFNNEEFRPASEMASQMLADELSWQQNYSYALPGTESAEKKYLNLSCFSGIIGELDLSVESCAGRKISVEEFFRRKCGNFGELSGNAVERPSLGLFVNSPKKKGQSVPLVDSTIMTEESSVGSYMGKDKTEQSIPNSTKEFEEQSIMSLTSIAQALQDIDNGTPRRLVDQLIMAKKNRKTTHIPDDKPVRDTYTLLSCNRKSLPATPSRTFDCMEKDTSMLNLSNKLSLDSKVINEMLEVKHNIPKMLSYNTRTDGKTSFEVACEELKKELSKGTSYNPDFKSIMEDQKLTLPHYTIEKEVLSNSSKSNSTLNPDRMSVNIEKEDIGNKGAIKEENVSYKDKTESFTQNISTLQGSQTEINSVVIGKSTEELCNCIVGISRETAIELLNNSDRWMTCSLSVYQVQGDRHNVHLTLPKGVILIKPNAVQNAKITVMMIKMCKPIITVMNITVSDMVTRSESIMKHIICFKPEELDISVSVPNQEKVLDFRYVVENDTSELPVTIKNKNNVNVPIKLFIKQDEPAMFSFDGSKDMQNIILKAQEVFIANIQCTAVQRKNSQKHQKSPQSYGGTLIVQTGNTSENSRTIKEVPLIVQVGTCKIHIGSTDLPLVISNKQSKSLTVRNLGSIPILIVASFIHESEPLNNSKCFLVQPESILVQPNESICFVVSFKQQNLDVSRCHVKLKLSAGNNSYIYPVIGETNMYTEAENEHFCRCETPQYLSSASSPSSPHSVASNKSGISGRNSPISTVSGSTVAGDKIPIRTTHAALVWNSTKLGKTEIKEFTIRNTSNNKIKIQAIIADNEKNFRFLRDRQAVGTTIILVLQGSESRTLSVIFSPHHLGAAVGKIVFRHYEPKRDDSESRPSKVLFLYGYGGYSKLDISEAFKDTSGKMWLSLGSLRSGGPLNAKIKLQNGGDLYSFVKVKLTPKAVYPTMISSWQVSPSELLLSPKETQWVTLEFHPRKEDLALLQRRDVSHVGTLLLVSGDEPTRWRIRRLYNKMKETGEFTGNESESFKNFIYPICKAFPGEKLMPDINAIRDTVQNLGDLCRGICQLEILLTMEVCADETLSMLQDNADESQMFYSLCSDNSHVYEGNGESFLPCESIVGNSSLQSNTNIENFVVNPSVVVLTPPSRTEATVTIKSSCMVAQAFETCLSNTQHLSVLPAEGMIPARRDFHLKIQCKRKIERSFNAVLEIYTENNKLDVQIRVNVKRL